MLLDNKYTIVPSIKFSLTYDNGVRKVITVKTQDTIDCSYKKNGEKFSIRGVVAKIGCNFNSSLGTVGTTAYLQIDGSSEYCGQVEYIQPNQVLDLTIIKTTDTIENVVCSVDNDDQKITLVRENEVGAFQYSIDGINWKSPTASQGMSAYECAVALGFEGTEKEWLESLKGEPGAPGEAGALEIYKVFSSIAEAENNSALIPVGKLVAVQSEPSSILLVRNGTSVPGCICGCQPISYDSSVVAVGYDFLGYLTLGPAGEPGEPGEPGKDGKSAYEYALEGGFVGTEAEFMQSLASQSVAVTNFYMGESTCSLMNTVIGPIDLRIFGYTDEKTFKSKAISKIDISCPTELDDQTLIFESPVILRAVPTLREAARPNLTIGNKKYVADVIMKKDGQIGVFRRIEYIKSYNGETILGDWLSSTGELDMGAEVQYTSYGTFEPFMDGVQSQYRKLHSYDGQTDIQTSEDGYISISYPIDVTNYIKEYVDQRSAEFLQEKAPEIIRPIVNDVIGTQLSGKQDKLTAGSNVTISDDNVISVDLSGLPSTEDMNRAVNSAVNSAVAPIKSTVNSLSSTVNSLNSTVNSLSSSVSGLSNSKQDKLTAGSNISIENGVISSTASGATTEEFTVTKEMGGLSIGTVVPAGTPYEDLFRQMLSPVTPPDEYKLYFGVSYAVPTSLDGLTSKTAVETDVITKGVFNRYTSNDERFVFAYPKTTGELISIKDSSGFENIDGWSRTEIEANGKPFYVYYTNETLTVTSFKITFIFTEE